MNLLSRDEFRETVFARDNHKCVICGASDEIAAHHILERCLWEDGGYYIDNGATLCPEHHLEAEKTTLSCEDIRLKAGVDTILPSKFDPNNIYDKWGNIILKDVLIKGELYDTEQFQKVISWYKFPYFCVDGEYFNKLIKYPRTRHVVGSGLQKGDEDDYVSFKELEGKHLVVEEKIDGANTGVSFHDCTLKLQCRGHYLEGHGDWPEFDQFKI